MRRMIDGNKRLFPLTRRRIILFLLFRVVQKCASAGHLDVFNATHLSEELEWDTTAPVKALWEARVAVDT